VVRVDFDLGGSGAAVGGEAAPGDSLMDLADAWAAPVELGCRAANCAACVVEVIAGSTLLSPLEPDERAVLDLFRAPPNARLACQARVAGIDGHVRLRVLQGGAHSLAEQARPPAVHIGP
jgi:ferredoxin